MKRFMKKLAPVVSLAALGLGSAASAGYTYEGASCYQYADGSGYCTGTLLGWRNSSQDSAYMYFYENSSNSRTFYARYMVSGSTSYSTYSCIPDASVSAVWDEALAHKGRFYIYWNVNGSCYNLSLYNGSAYSNF